MSFFRMLPEKLESLIRLIVPQERWLIVISADPDALGSSMALRQIIRSHGGLADIAHVNDISRPDNLAMIRTLRIPIIRLTPDLAKCCQRFAMVDSQPHHSTDFPQVDYDVILDHHPLDPAYPVRAQYLDIRANYGACSSLLTEYLYNLRIKPGKLLATALLYGIKTDTGSFERDFSDVDVKAFSYLSKLSDKMLLRRIVHAEFNRKWLKYFARAFERSRSVGREGLFAYVGRWTIRTRWWCWPTSSFACTASPGTAWPDSTENALWLLCARMGSGATWEAGHRIGSASSGALAGTRWQLARK